MNKSFEIEAVTVLELVRYASQLTDETEQTELSEHYWQELCRDVSRLSQQALSDEQKWHSFKQLFYTQWTFSIASDDYFTLARNNLCSLMIDRQCNNSLMAIIINELLMLLELDALLIDFPGALVIQLSGLDGQYIDPLTGDELGDSQLEGLVRGHLGDHLRLQDKHLIAATPEAIKKRYLVCIKQSCLLEQQYEHALIFNQLLLELLPNDPQQRMERGFVLQQLECFEGARDDFSYYIDNCPDDPNSDVLKMHIKTLKYQSNIFH